MSTLPLETAAIVQLSSLDAREPAMTPTDRQFTKELGRRLAQLRQDAGLTQQAMAAELGVAQQTLAHYEVGRLRLPVVLVPKVAALFGVPTDVLLGVTSARTAAQGKRGPTPKLQRQLERVSRLPKAQQQVVLAMLDGVLLQHG